MLLVQRPRISISIAPYQIDNYSRHQTTLMFVTPLPHGCSSYSCNTCQNNCTCTPPTKTNATKNMSSSSRSFGNTISNVCHTIHNIFLKPSMLEIPKLGIHFVTIKTDLLIQTLGDLPFLTSMIMCYLLRFKINDVGDRRHGIQ